MKRYLLAAGLLFISAAAGVTDRKIEIKDHVFIPTKMTIQAGTKVTWINQDDDPHTVVEKDGVFRSGALDTQDSFSYVFTKAGTYPYFCTLHPMMVGSIKVVGAKPSKKRSSDP